MRYDTPIYFQRITPGKYDASTGNHGEDTIAEEKRYASVNDTGDDTLHLLLGKITQGGKTVILQNHYNEPFDRIKIGEKVYAVIRARRLRVKHVFIVSEVQ